MITTPGVFTQVPVSNGLLTSHPDPRVRDGEMSALDALVDRVGIAWAIATQRPRPPGFEELVWTEYLSKLPPERLLRRLTWPPPVVLPQRERGAWHPVMRTPAMALVAPAMFHEIAWYLERVVEQFIGRNVMEMRSALTSRMVQATRELESVLGVEVEVNNVSVEDDPHHPRRLLWRLNLRVTRPHWLMSDRQVVLEVQS